jgi:hypothetical protein
MRHIIILFCAVLVYGTAHAQIFVKQDAAGNNDGTSWADAFTSLQSALDASDTGDELWLSWGTYLPAGPSPDSSHFVLRTAVAIYGGFVGTETQLNERDWTTHLTIISGDLNQDDTPGDFLNQRTDNAHHVLIVDVNDSTSIIDGVVFRGGMTRVDTYTPTGADMPYNRWRGGALYIRTSTIVRNCVFRDNYGYQGTGMWASAASLEHTLELSNSLIAENNCVGGGSWYVSGWNAVTIHACVFENNTSAISSGAIQLGNSNASFRDCLFESNQANGEGGAILIFQNANSTVIEPVLGFTNCLFSNNSASFRSGALGFNNFAFGFTLAIDSCTFTGNKVTGQNGAGGALSIYDQTDAGIIGFDEQSVTIHNTTFDNNSATFAGAVFCVAIDDSMSVVISNTTITNNLALVSAGGLLIARGLNGRANFEILNASFLNNGAESYAGALEISYSTGLIENSIFRGNEGIGASGAFDIAGGTTFIKNSLFSENYTAGVYPGYEGGGAGIFWDGAEVSITNSIFDGNISDAGGAAVLSLAPTTMHFENTLLINQIGNNTLENRAALRLTNTTLVNNQAGLFLTGSSQTELQNTLLANTGANMATDGLVTIISNGGNISSDGSMATALTGFGVYDDFNNTEPLLGPDYVPLSGSPCIDGGNPDGITSLYDLAGNPRLHGKSIDIGCYESFLSGVKDVSWDASFIEVFPNPVVETLQFELNTDWAGVFDIVMYNHLGQQIYREQKRKSDIIEHYQLSVNHLVPGNYLLLIISDKATYASNMIIQR